MKKMIKACIFDLDGTLADTLESMAYVANQIMEKFSLKSQPTDNFRYYLSLIHISEPTRH